MKTNAFKNIIAKLFVIAVVYFLNSPLKLSLVSAQVDHKYKLEKELYLKAFVLIGIDNREAKKKLLKIIKRVPPPHLLYRKALNLLHYFFKKQMNKKNSAIKTKNKRVRHSNDVILKITFDDWKKMEKTYGIRSCSFENIIPWRLRYSDLTCSYKKRICSLFYNEQ